MIDGSDRDLLHQQSIRFRNLKSSGTDNRSEKHEGHVGCWLKGKRPDVWCPEDDDKERNPARPKGAPDWAYLSPEIGRMVGVDAKLFGQRSDGLDRDATIAASYLGCLQRRIADFEYKLNHYKAELMRYDRCPDMKRYIEQQIRILEDCHLSPDRTNEERVRRGMSGDESRGGVVSYSVNDRPAVWQGRMKGFAEQIKNWSDNGSWDEPVVLAVTDVTQEAFTDHDAELIHKAFQSQMFPAISGVLYSTDWTSNPVLWIPNHGARYVEDLRRYLDGTLVSEL
ncbi:MAG: hypothetical protein OXE87_10185 [Chloroflexi bacterium]|nr:hypothetical protein [Chloroflexota bacterium]